MKKKTIIAFTCLALLIGILPVTTFAQDKPTRTFGSNGGKDDNGRNGRTRAWSPDSSEPHKGPCS